MYYSILAETVSKDLKQNFKFEVGPGTGVPNVSTSDMRDILSGTWTWDGTLTVLATDTSGVAVNDWIQKDEGSPFFKITAITPNVDVTIENPQAKTIPASGTGALKVNKVEVFVDDAHPLKATLEADLTHINDNLKLNDDCDDIEVRV